MTIDSEIRHVTKADANVFMELGFPVDEAKRLYAASQRQIDAHGLKEQLMTELANWITQNHLNEVQAAQILMVSPPHVSDILNRKAAKFTLDTLVEMLGRVGKSVKLVVG